MCDCVAFEGLAALSIVFSTALNCVTFVVLAGLSFVLSTVLIGWGIPRLRKEEDARREARDADRDNAEALDATVEQLRGPVFDWRSPGLWIGVCEILLVFPLVYHGEFGALAIIFGAKEYVRKKKIQENPSRYLLGTLVNLSIAVLFALLAKRMVQ